MTETKGKFYFLVKSSCLGVKMENLECQSPPGLLEVAREGVDRPQGAASPR